MYIQEKIEACRRLISTVGWLRLLTLVKNSYSCIDLPRAYKLLLFWNKINKKGTFGNHQLLQDCIHQKMNEIRNSIDFNIQHFMQYYGA